MGILPRNSCQNNKNLQRNTVSQHCCFIPVAKMLTIIAANPRTRIVSIAIVPNFSDVVYTSFVVVRRRSSISRYIK